MNPKISIITPVFNASEYLEISINSVLSQSLDTIELILINDGSTDNSLDICKSYELNDSRVTVIDQINKGVASARQSGLRVARGEYIIHLDSDDYFFEDALEKLYNEAVTTNSDIVIGSYMITDSESGNSELCRLPIKNIDAKQLVNEMISGEIHGALWNKLIKRELYNGIYFDEGLDFMEDVLILTKILLINKPKTILFKDIPVVSYNQIPGSYTNSYSKEYLDKGVSIVKKIESIINEYNPTNESKYINNLKVRVLLLYSLYLTDLDLNLSNVFPELTTKDLWISNIRLRQKILLQSDLMGLSSIKQAYVFIKNIKRKML